MSSQGAFKKTQGYDWILECNSLQSLGAITEKALSPIQEEKEQRAIRWEGDDD